MGTISKIEAQELLESLSLIGEGWWRTAKLGLNMGAHRALGMTPREFVLSIGRQETLNAKDIVLELHSDGTSITRITEIVGMSDRTVKMILAKAGRIEITPAIQRMLETGKTEPDRSDRRARGDSAGETTARAAVIDAEVIDETQEIDLREQIDALAAQVKAEKAKRDKDIEDLKSKMHAKLKAAVEEERNNWMTEEERDKLRAEAKASVESEAAEMLNALSGLLVRNVIDEITTAADSLRTLRRDNANIDSDTLAKIEAAAANLGEEVRITKAAVGN